jgi:hypothetical protein
MSEPKRVIDFRDTVIRNLPLPPPGADRVEYRFRQRNGLTMRVYLPTLRHPDGRRVFRAAAPHEANGRTPGRLRQVCCADTARHRKHNRTHFPRAWCSAQPFGLLLGGSMPYHLNLAVGDGARRLTYAELAVVRGISLPSARRLVLRHHWPRQAGNDGVVRVTVPLTALAKGAETVGFRDTVTDVGQSHPTDTVTPAADPTTDPVTVTLTRAVESLREQLGRERMRADRAEIAVDHLRGRIDQLMTLLADRRPWWRRWFR